MEDIKLKLNLEEVNILLKSLSKEPFKDVFELIGKINEQAGEQIQKFNQFELDKEDEPAT